jgi:hypothetical protein
MNISAPDVLVRSLAGIVSRREFLTGMTTVLSLRLPVVLGPDEAEAKHYKKHSRHKHNHSGKNNHRHKRKNQQQTPPPPPPPPVADPIVRSDATCTSSEVGEVVIGDEDSRLAQTFTALASGSLVRADLDIAAPAGSSGDLVLRLSPVKQSGETLPPTNDVLSEATVAAANVPAQISTITFSFGTPFSVTAGVTYALVLSRPGGDRFFWVGHENDPCAGAAFFSPDQTAGFLDISPDLVFTTFVRS